MARFGSVSLGLVPLLLFTGGCATDHAMRADASANEVCPRADALIRETQAQLAGLRAEMAATRIDAAKKEAELQGLRLQVEALQRERVKLQKVQAESQIALEEQEATLRAVRQERDHLAEAHRLRATGRAPVSAERDPDEAGVAARPVEAKVEALEASIVALTAQIQRLKGREDGVSPDKQGQAVRLIRVEPGETLGKLAKRYGVSVEDLRAANGLTGDLILVGQQLFIPSAQASASASR